MPADRDRVAVAWRERDAPLAPAAVAARGSASRTLARRLLTLDDERLGRLRGVAGSGLLVLVGAADDLPWVDGVVYLGVDPRARALLLPTTLEPDAPLPLLERALLDRRDRPPLAVLLEPPALVSVGAARPVARAALAAWLEGRA